MLAAAAPTSPPSTTSPAAALRPRPTDPSRSATVTDPMNTPQELNAATEANPDASAARRFQQTFTPQIGADYSWVEQYAKQQYETGLKMFADLDAKAASIITALSSATGLFTLGSLAAISSAKVPAGVVAWAAPSLICAVLAIVCAALVRRPRSIFQPPTAETMVSMADQYPTETDTRGRAMMIPLWNWCFALLREPLDIKAWYIERSTWLTVASVTLLLLPFFAMLFKS